MEFPVVLSVIFFLLFFSCVCAEEQRCPDGQYTKEKPSPEKDLATCKSFSCNSCCTRTITEQLVLRPLQMVGGLNYSQCGGLSDMCSMWSAYIQCFYQCSPNLTPWLDNKNDLRALPVCSTFCDTWYSACQYDKTCVDGTDWSKGFDIIVDPSDPKKKTIQCKPDIQCRNYSDVYLSAESMCNKMWDGMLKYTTDETNCLDPANMEKNSVVVNNTGRAIQTSVCDSVEYTDTGMIIGIVVGVIAGLLLIIAIVLLVRNSKKNAKKMQPPSEETAKEMKALNQPQPT